MLDSLTLVHYLVAQNLLDIEKVVDGGLTIVPQRSRNFSFRVSGAGADALFVKQARPLDESARITIDREALWYDALLQIAPRTPLLDHLPRIHAHDPDHAILITELVESSQNLSEYHRQTGSFPERVGAMLAQGLAHCHTLPLPIFEELAGRALHSQVPWILGFATHQQLFRDEPGNGIRELLRVVQRDKQFERLLLGLRERWSPTAIMHGDLKWENCLVVIDPQSRTPLSTRLIDWETFGLGDPAWDVGGIFHAFLAFWIWSMPLGVEMSHTAMIEGARHPVESMQPVIRSFWQTYCATVGLAGDAAREMLVRSVEYCGARLLQTTYESLRGAAALSGHGVFLIQLAQNILANPHEAASTLLGLFAPLLLPFEPAYEVSS